jgi:hypothetical protein
MAQQTIEIQKALKNDFSQSNVRVVVAV